ncbi:hypothetical protein vseg_008099 [Gypsophila vaccaria]
MDQSMCNECLQRRIHSDFSDEIVFSYALAHSPLPFSSTAVVQVRNSSGESSSLEEFVLVYLPRGDDDCLSLYVDDHILDDIQSLENLGTDQNKANSALNDSNVEYVFMTDQSHVLEDGMKIDLYGLHCVNSSCYYSGRSSCLRTITALAPCAFVGNCSISALEKIASNLSSGSLEDDILCSLSAMIEGKATSRASQNFLRLVGVPSFHDEHVPGCLRHPNLVPVLGILKASGFTSVVYPKASYTLENILHFSPEALDFDWNRRFLVYQLLSALSYIHGLGLSHGNICPSTVMFANSSWVWLSICDVAHWQYNSNAKVGNSLDLSLIGNNCAAHDCFSRSLYEDLSISELLDWPTAFHKWWKGELSNFGYLLFLNKLAGRRWGDHTFHTVMPWVIDFSVKPHEHSEIGWRDLSKSKWRLAKGDEQLDFTYSTSEFPHHVSDECLSELAVCSYKARRLPLSVLRMAVRSVYEPNEYPSTMQRLYQWTPDECIPEFYCDSRIFSSLHFGMSDLAVPSWASSPQEFIKLHRDALESERVSREIHKWIDITFGYQMSGQPAVDAKNVMLPSSQPTIPRPIGRRQLFYKPHPVRWGNTRRIHVQSIVEQHNENFDSEISSFHQNDYLSKMEEACAFCEHAQNLSPIYSDKIQSSVKSSHTEQISKQGLKDCTHEANQNKFNFSTSLEVHCNDLLSYLEEAENYKAYQELVLWAQQSSCSKEVSIDGAKDIFSLGCVIAELYLRKPLFDSISVFTYMDDGTLPIRVRELPPHVKLIVEACIQKDWRRRPSVKCLLECPYFAASVKSSYLFIAPLQLLATNSSRLCYAANFAKKGALRSMGSFAAERCATHCLPFLEFPLSDIDADCAYVLLKEFLKSLQVEAITKLVLPSIQKILQATGYSHLKVSLLQDSFVREVWNHIGKQTYLEKVHPLVISNLLNSPDKNSASAASVLLISSSEELGVPISVQQTILPLIQSFGRGLCADGVDSLVRIGVVLGEHFIITQILPLLKNFIHSCIDTSFINKPEPVQSWNSLALVDCLRALDGLIAFLQKEVVVKRLLESQNCLFVAILMRSGLELSALQAAATTLVTVCQQIGPDLTAVHVLPHLKQLFDELVFSKELSCRPSSLSKSDTISIAGQEAETQVESHMDIVLLLYPSLASLLGIERLRHCCATWLLIEKYLLMRHNWKWEFTGTLSRSNPWHLNGKQTVDQESDMCKYNNTSKMLMNGVGWTVPQSQGSKISKDLVLHKRLYEGRQKTSETINIGKCEPWFWFPTPASSWDGPDFLARSGTIKDEVPWKIKASVVHSVRAHHGALRSLAVDQDECTIFTAGVGPGFKGMVQRWNMSTVDCVSGYYGHEEVVNDLCILPSKGRVASCDGTIHVWNSQTGKAISVISESVANGVQPNISSSSAARFSNDQDSILNSSPHSSGIFTSVDGSLYTCMHLLENVEKVVVGTGNGSVRFIDAASGEKLHMWNSDPADYGFPSLVSALCSCGSDNTDVNSPHSWIAVGLSSGNCRLLDVRSGCVVASWRAHDGYVTKLAAPEDHYLVSSSLDKTIRIWDLRKNLPPEPIVYKGHTDSILDFAVWGQDVISVSKNRIGLSSLTGTPDEYGQHRVVRQALYTADRGTRNMSILSSIAILPFSRLFLVGTEDGQLKICS